jgi:hypothetical protein
VNGTQIDIRASPDIDAERTPYTLDPGDVFQACEERMGAHGVLYLRLADGRGWVFDKKPGLGCMCSRLARYVGSAHVASATPNVVPGAVSVWIHTPEYLAPLALRATPDVNGPRTSNMLMPGDEFAVSEEFQGAGGILYLKLSDGRGWAFDRKPGVGGMCSRKPVLSAGFAAQMPAGSLRAPPGGPPATINGPLTPGAPATPATFLTQWIYSPDIKVPIDVRATPDVNGPRCPTTLSPGEIFQVAEERASPDGIIFLKLADGRGWVFDRKPGAGNMCARHTAPVSRQFSVAQIVNGYATPTAGGATTPIVGGGAATPVVGGGATPTMVHRVAQNGSTFNFPVSMPMLHGGAVTPPPPMPPGNSITVSPMFPGGPASVAASPGLPSRC